MIQNVQILPRNETHWQDNEWKKLLSGAIESPKELLSILDLADSELAKQIDPNQKFSQRVPTPFIKKMEKGNPQDPLLLQVLPIQDENIKTDGFVADPLDEASALHKTGMSGLLHKYQSRVLFMLATHCAVNCRYCFRREFPYQENRASKSDWSKLGHYLSEHPEINEVIISGGDPLAVNDSYLTDFVRFIERFPQVIRLRIHTRLPVVIPQRITSSLLNLSQSRLQMVMVLHVNHPNEIDAKLIKACQLLSDNGFHLLNQSVLLQGINDNVDTLSKLSEKLFSAKVTPYYLHLLDQVQGAAHFNIEHDQAKSLYKNLQRRLAGFLVPKMVQEVAGEPNKTLII